MSEDAIETLNSDADEAASCLACEVSDEILEAAGSTLAGADRPFGAWTNTEHSCPNC